MDFKLFDLKSFETFTKIFPFKSKYYNNLIKMIVFAADMLNKDLLLLLWNFFPTVCIAC